MLNQKLQDQYTGFYCQHKRRKEGVYLLYKKDEFKELNSINTVIAGGDSENAASILLLHKATRKGIFVTTSHFKSGQPTARNAGTLDLGEVLNLSDKNSVHLNIVTGDFNQEAGALDNHRIERVAKKIFGFQEQMEGSYPTEPSSGRRIDATLYKPDWQTPVTVQTASQNTAQLYKGWSDHLPWIQTFTFNNLRPSPQLAQTPSQNQSAPCPVKASSSTTPSAPPISPKQGTLPPQSRPTPISQKAPSPPTPPQLKGLRRFLTSIWDGMASFFRYLFGSFFKKP